MSIKTTNAPANAPKVGDKVYLPELAVWGEIIEFYNENSQLITTVRAVVNGKPTIIEVTALVVQLADAVRDAVTLWGKIKTAAKSLCQKLGLCKAKPARAPLSLLQAIADAERELVTLAQQRKDLVLTENSTSDEFSTLVSIDRRTEQLKHVIADLSGFLPKK